MNKNILILSRGFRAGDAITTLNLFSKWPKENLFCASLIESEYTGSFSDFYLLGDKEVKYVFPFNMISSPQPSHIGSNFLKYSHDSTSSLLSKVYQKYGRPFLQWLDMYETRLSVSLSPEFENWIDRIKPYAIYTSIGDIAMARFILEFHERYPGIKIIVHGFDDWLSPTYKIIKPKTHRALAESLFRQILSVATGRFTSSRKMADEYRLKYGYDFICFPNPVKIIDMAYNLGKNDIPNIVFTGKVGWHNNKAIKEMMAAVESLSAGGTNIRFDIYTDSSKSRLCSFLGEIPDTTVIHEPVPNQKIPGILAQSHILYLPINIDQQTAMFTKYSMSTKMGEYLSSGVPVIYYGPKDIAMTEFLQEGECAYMVLQKGGDGLKTIITNILASRDQDKIDKGIEIANNYFNIEIVSHDFAEKLQEL